ncbi:hypothetical protein BT67DRAFT_129823 [Trichocladium antarcticum]|uniref:Uncharacterized protein n=1 Tax=Trichocladium antarcticum TaxID=1450529 RepID=A0AAN6USD9_9PEZI|nr:hypothetical protein BT67DRAFT_129823 [Trichocladium antarcticum]
MHHTMLCNFVYVHTGRTLATLALFPASHIQNGSLHVRVAQRTVGKIFRWHHHPCGVRSLRRRIHRPPPTIPSLVASPMRGCTPLFADWTSLPVGHLRNAKINEIRSGGGRGSQHEASGVRDLSFVTLQPRLCTDSSTLTGKYLPWSLDSCEGEV